MSLAYVQSMYSTVTVLPVFRVTLTVHCRDYQPRFIFKVVKLDLGSQVYCLITSWDCVVTFYDLFTMTVSRALLLTIIDRLSANP
jgi:hypothetical protein